MAGEKQLGELKEQMEAISKAEERLNQVLKLMGSLKTELEAKARVMDEEYRDVEKLEKISTSQLFHRILGDIGTKVAKEKQEYLQAVLSYDDTANKMKLLMYEQELLEKKIATKDNVQAMFEKFLHKKAETILADPNHVFRKTILKFAEKTEALNKTKAKIAEADISANRLIEYLFSVFELMSKIDPWYDISKSPEYLSYQRKKFHAGSRQVISMIDHLMQELEADVKDIGGGLAVKVDYRPLNHFVDNLHKEVILGWQTNTHLARAKNSIEQNIANVRVLINQLKYLTEKADKEIEILEAEKKLYIEQA